MRILLAEDEPGIADDIMRALQASGYVVDGTNNGEEAWYLGSTEEFAAIILDLGLPVMDGLSVLKKWRSADVMTPVLVLTARGTWMERVEGIDAGADDYLAKPFRMEELLARLRSVIRRDRGQPGPVIRSGRVALDVVVMSVRVDGVTVGLTPLEFRAVSCLMHNKGRIVSAQELIEHVHGTHSNRDNNALEALIRRLRQKIGVPLIKTRRGFGYTIEADPDGPSNADK